MLDWLVIWVPLGLTALVFSLALATDPNDVEVRSFTSSESAVARGYSSERLAIQLGNDIVHIMQVASTHHLPKSIEVGVADEPVEHLVDYFDINPFVKAVQEAFGAVLYVADIALVDDESGNPVVSMDVHRVEDSQTVYVSQIENRNGKIDDLIKRTAENIVKISQPYIFAAYLHNEYKYRRRTTILVQMMNFLKVILPAVKREERIWYLNLLGITAYETGQYDVAVGFFQEALEIDPDFALAEINMGRALHSLGLDEAAIDYYRSALHDDELSDVSIGFVYWAQSLAALGDLEAALAKLAVAEAMTPDLALTYAVRADILEQEGHTEAAQRQRRYAGYARIRRPRQTFYEAV